MGDSDPVTVGQLKQLITPLTERLDNLSHRVASIQITPKNSPHLVESDDVNSEKQGTSTKTKSCLITGVLVFLIVVVIFLCLAYWKFFMPEPQPAYPPGYSPYNPQGYIPPPPPAQPAHAPADEFGSGNWYDT